MDELADHGTVKRYGQGCPCDPCAEAARPWQERWDALEQPRLTVEDRRRRRNASTRRSRLRRLEQAAAGLLVIPHGTAGGRNNYGCPCEPCVEAARRQWRLYRQNKKEAG